MKKLIAALAIAATVLLVAGFVYVLMFMEDTENPPAGQSQSGGDSTSNARLNAPKAVETDADVLDALDYYTQRNQDTVAWLRVPGTKINDPVLQSHDNFTYLRTDEFREYDLYGCYFADWECSIGPRSVLSPNTVVYGHSDLTDQADGPRFSQLFHFADPEFAAATPVIHFSTLEEQMTWEVFAVIYTNTSFSYINAEPEGGAQALAQAAMEKSIYDYGVSVGEEDKILTLSTCSVRDNPQDRSQRFVVMARLLPADAEVPQKATVTPRTPE
mgnify:FL=1